MDGSVDLLRDLQGLLNHGAAVLGHFFDGLDQGGVDLLGGFQECLQEFLTPFLVGIFPCSQVVGPVQGQGIPGQVPPGLVLFAFPNQDSELFEPVKNDVQVNTQLFSGGFGLLQGLRFRWGKLLGGEGVLGTRGMLSQAESCHQYAEGDQPADQWCAE